MKTFLPIASSIFLLSFAFSGCDSPEEHEHHGPRAPRYAHYDAHPGARHQDEDDRYEGQYDSGEHGPYEGPGPEDRGPGRYHPRDDEGAAPEDDQGPAPSREYHDDSRGGGREYHGGDHAGLPRGRRTPREGFVISPYPPHNQIDVRGIPSGAKVMDPSVHKVFINP